MTFWLITQHNGSFKNFDQKYVHDKRVLIRKDLKIFMSTVYNQIVV